MSLSQVSVNGGGCEGPAHELTKLARVQVMNQSQEQATRSAHKRGCTH
jgi:hypothetical protein